jgi:hypothetical protein
MGFDFVNTRIYGETGPVTISSGSVAYPVLNANVTVGTVTTLGVATTGSLIVRNGLIIGLVGAFTSSNQPF